MAGPARGQLLDEPAAFDQVYDEARAAKARGEDPAPYMTENATGGLGARNGGAFRSARSCARHGGIATARTGGNIHVSLSDYDHTVENHNRLLQPAGAESRGPRSPRDVVLHPQLGPGPRLHQRRQGPAGEPGPSGVNFGSVEGTRADHAEFRMWDGSLRPGVIQAQINLSLGMTAAAARGGYTPPPHEPRGSHLNRNPRRRRMRGEEWRGQTRSFRQLADTVFRRARNSAQATALFASTRWQAGS